MIKLENHNNERSTFFFSCTGMNRTAITLLCLPVLENRTANKHSSYKVAVSLRLCNFDGQFCPKKLPFDTPLVFTQHLYAGCKIMLDLVKSTKKWSLASLLDFFCCEIEERGSNLVTFEMRGGNNFKKTYLRGVLKELNARLRGGVNFLTPCTPTQKAGTEKAKEEEKN